LGAAGEEKDAAKRKSFFIRICGRRTSDKYSTKAAKVGSSVMIFAAFR